MFPLLAAPWNVIVVFILAALTHIPVDLFVKLTFHTPDPYPKWPFWVGANVGFGVASLITAILLWTPYWWTMLAANLVDLYDWVFLRSYQALKRKKNPQYDIKPYFIHTYLEKFRDKYLTWVPEWWFKKRGVIPEIIIDTVGFLLLFLI